MFDPSSGPSIVHVSPFKSNCHFPAVTVFVPPVPQAITADIGAIADAILPVNNNNFFIFLLFMFILFVFLKFSMFLFNYIYYFIFIFFTLSMNRTKIKIKIYIISNKYFLKGIVFILKKIRWI